MGIQIQQKRLESWANLRPLRGTSSLPWLVIGHFISKKEGGSLQPRQQIEGFIDTINWCGFWDIGFSRPKFTWIYHKLDGTQIRERLDRALASKDWCSRFPAAKLIHLTSIASNHSPLLLWLSPTSRKRKMRKVFRFELMRLKDPHCEDVVRDAWEEGLAAN